MWYKINERIKLEIIITVFATLISLIFICLSYIFKEVSTEILSLLIIILPTVYIVGNLLAKGLMQHGFNKWMDEVNQVLDEQEETIKKLQKENEQWRDM